MAMVFASSAWNAVSTAVVVEVPGTPEARSIRSANDLIPADAIDQAATGAGEENLLRSLLSQPFRGNFELVGVEHLRQRRVGHDAVFQLDRFGGDRNLVRQQHAVLRQTVQIAVEIDDADGGFHDLAG